MHQNRRKNQHIHCESMMVPVGSGGQQLHMQRFYANRHMPGTPVFMVHGLVEDGGIFYSTKGHGLAWFMATQGFDVYVPDLRGKGKSWPALSAESTDGLHEAINEDIPALVKAIAKKRGPIPQVWISHAWGGVLTSSYFARYGERFAPVQSMVYFGSRRYVGENGWRKNLALKGVWKNAMMMASRLSGYVPAQQLHLGTSNESRSYFEDVLRWMFEVEWTDKIDDFDYSVAAKLRTFPSSMYFASEADSVYGCPKDVRRFINDLGEHVGRLVMLSKRGGSRHDYGHIDMLSGIDAETDHFPILIDWLSAQSPEQAVPTESYTDEVPTLDAAIA